MPYPFEVEVVLDTHFRRQAAYFLVPTAATSTLYASGPVRWNRSTPRFCTPLTRGGRTPSPPSCTRKVLLPYSASETLTIAPEGFVSVSQVRLPLEAPKNSRNTGLGICTSE